MKPIQIISLIIVVALVASGIFIVLTDSTDADDTPTVCVTLSWQKEMVETIAGDDIKIVQLISAGTTPHDAGALAPGDIVSYSNSMAYFYMGSNMGWEEANIPTLVENIPDITLVNCSEGIELIQSDAHVWTSPDNLIIIAGNVKDALVELDPENTSTYESGYAAYLGEVNGIKTLAETTLSDHNGSTFLAWHNAWNYLARDYNLTAVGLEGEISSDTMSAEDLARIFEIADGYNLTSIFSGPNDPLYEDEVRDELEEEGLEVVLANPLAVDFLDELERFITNLGDSWE